MIRDVKRTPARPQPARVTVVVAEDVFTAAVTGEKELALPDSAQVNVGDIVHLVERVDGGLTGRCCYRLVTRKRRGVGLVTVQSAKGQCERRHGS